MDAYLVVANLAIVIASDVVAHFDHRAVKFSASNVANEALDLDLHCADFDYDVN